MTKVTSSVSTKDAAGRYSKEQEYSSEIVYEATILVMMQLTLRYSAIQCTWKDPSLIYCLHVLNSKNSWRSAAHMHGKAND
jgi:hypothetical protein